MIYHICNPSIYISQFYLFSNKYKIHGNLDFRYIFLEKTDILTNRKDVRYVSFFRLLKLFLLLKKIEPAYSMIAGAFVGGVIGGAGLAGTVIICTLLSEKGRKK